MRLDTETDGLERMLYPAMGSLVTNAGVRKTLVNLVAHEEAIGG